MIKFEVRPLKIERIHQVDVDIKADSNEQALDWAAEVGMSLLLDYRLVLPLVIDGVLVNHIGVLRFTGTRTQLAELINQLG